MMKMMTLALFLGGTTMNAMGGVESKETINEERIINNIVDTLMRAESAYREGRRTSNENQDTGGKNPDESPDTGGKNCD